MLIVGDIIAFPARGLFRVFEELANAVDAELEAEARSVTEQLQELYLLLESGRISEEEFEEREEVLLDLLDDEKDEEDEDDE